MDWTSGAEGGLHPLSSPEKVKGFLKFHLKMRVGKLHLIIDLAT